MTTTRQSPFCLLLLLALVALFATLVQSAEHILKVKVTAGPSAPDEEGKAGKCPSPEETITDGDYAMIHYTLWVDESSETGEPGKQYESTRTDDQPIGVTLGHGEVIAGWDEGLVGLCKGDFVTLIVPPHLGYGDSGTGVDPEKDIPGGATLKFEIEIVSVEEGPTEEEDDEKAMEMFDNADIDKDGKLSREEFDAMFKAELEKDTKNPPNEEEMEMIHEQLQKFWESQDEDKDGFLTLEEFLSPSDFDHDAGAGDMLQDEVDPRDEFDQLDTNKDGKLSMEEIKGFFDSLEQEVPEDFWLHLDENKDGFITFDEFFVEQDEDEEFYGDEDFEEEEEEEEEEPEL